ncbi:MAG: nitroreductase [Pseudonocardiales bacterium]|nr:nitroreductase [Pseudonocardiales bacterium]
MEFSEVVRRRRMVRRYLPERPVPRARLDRLLETAVRAPSAGFSQGWHFLVLDEPGPVADYWRVTASIPTTDKPDSESESAPEPAPADQWLSGMQTAPVIIVVFSDRRAYEKRYAQPDKATRSDTPTDLDERWPVPYWHLDAAMAGLLILLSAVDDELGACFFGVPTARVEALRQLFGLPVDLVPVGAITIGFADPDHRSKPARHRPMADVVSYGSYRCAEPVSPTAWSATGAASG